MSLVLASPGHAGLVLVAGPGPSTIAVNNFGFSGTYNDLRGPGGTSERVAHPGGGPVAFLYVFSNGGGLSTYFDSTAGPYDGADDTQVAVLNNSSTVINAFSVRGPTNTFGFDGDGISSSAYGAPTNASDSTRYGGPNVFFTGYNFGNLSTGTINFLGGLAANGGTTYLSLEEAPTLSSPIMPAPEPSSLILSALGVTLASGFLARRRAIAARHV